MPSLTLALMFLLAAAPADRPATVNELLFELCPRVIAGEVDLTNRQQVKALGMVPRAGTLEWVHADIGQGKERISVGYKRFTNKKACQVGFGGADNEALFRSIVKAGEARGWRPGEGAAELGGLVSFLHPPAPSTETIMFTHWDEYDGLKPATNAALIVKDAP